jgi:hypothetical protein
MFPAPSEENSACADGRELLAQPPVLQRGDPGPLLEVTDEMRLVGKPLLAVDPDNMPHFRFRGTRQIDIRNGKVISNVDDDDLVRTGKGDPIPDHIPAEKADVFDKVLQRTPGSMEGDIHRTKYTKPPRRRRMTVPVRPAPHFLSTNSRP